MVGYLREFCESIYDFSILQHEMPSLSDSQIEQVRFVQRTRVQSEAKYREDMRVIGQLERSTQFGPSQLRALREWLQKIEMNIDSDITLDILSIAINDTLPDLASANPIGWQNDAEPFLQKALGVFDVNNDGLINLKALMCGLAVICKGSAIEKLQLCFELFSGQDGFMRKQQLSDLLSTLYSIYFQREFQREVSFFVDMIFQEADKNADGLLSFAEFRDASQKQPFIMKCFRLDVPHDDPLPPVVPQRAPPPVQKQDDMLKDPEEWVVM